VSQQRRLRSKQKGGDTYEYEALEQRIQALTEKVEKLDRIVYRLWKDRKAVVNDRSHSKDTEYA
jgi:hypothetical protein